MQLTTLSSAFGIMVVRLIMTQPTARRRINTFSKLYNRTNKKVYDSQIWHYNICHTNIIVMKDVILVIKKGGELLAMENVDKIAIAEVAKVASTIDFRSKHGWAISNADIDAAEDLGLTSIKKYWRCAGQIQDKVDLLHKD